MAIYYLLFALTLAASADQHRTMAITIDDLPVNSTSSESAMKKQVTLDLVATLKRERIPAVGFVNESKLEEAGQLNPANLDLLSTWLASGLELGNHGYQHLDLHRVPLAAFLEDIELGLRYTRPLAEKLNMPYRYFRHPFLHAGRSAEDRKAVLNTLHRLKLQVAPVTIDNGEWIYARAYDVAIDKGQLTLALSIHSDYLRYMGEVVKYYQDQSIKLLGYELPQVLLIHANRLNASTLPHLVANLREDGYQFVTLTDALRDPAYDHGDQYYGSSGITWLHRWALTAGKRGAFFAGEPSVPAFVKAASGLDL